MFPPANGREGDVCRGAGCLEVCRGATCADTFFCRKQATPACTKSPTFDRYSPRSLLTSQPPPPPIYHLPPLRPVPLARAFPQVGDDAVVALAAGPCRQSLKRLDLSGTATKGRCLASLRSLGQLEYLALSSTDSWVSATSVAALARDLRLPACLPEAPKTRGRCSRSLLSGSEWSERQLRCVPRKRRGGGGAAAGSWQNSAPTICYEHRGGGGGGGGSSKAIRLLGAASRCASSPSSSPFSSDDLVKVGFREGGLGDGGRQLLLSLIQGIVELWPAVPSR